MSNTIDKGVPFPNGEYGSAPKRTMVPSFQIDKAIPVPTYRAGQGKWSGINWLEIAQRMNLGDSVFMEGGRCQSSVCHALGLLGYKAAARKVPGGVRIWRIK